MTKEFNLDDYFNYLDNSIKNILLRKEKDILTFDILDTEKSSKYKLIALKQKHFQMKIGEIWQEVLGNYDGWTNLKTGHSTGLDLLSTDKKIIIELKNRTNTDNSSSKKTNFNKLAEFKKKNPDYTCIYANINDNNKKKTLEGTVKKILHKKIEIEHHIGYNFLKFILEDNVDIIIEFVKKSIDKYYDFD